MITTTNKGPNSVEIAYTAAETLGNIISAVEAWITQHGWELYDASAGVNARAYRALCNDGQRYKYVVLDYNTSGYVLCKTYESWNPATHVGTNLAFYSDNISYAQRINLTTGGSLYIFATNRYLILFSNNSGVIGSSTGNAWCGCIETTTDNPEDIPALGYPCWVWMNGYLCHATGQYVVSFCRMRNGATGQNAATASFVSTEMGIGGLDTQGNYKAIWYYIPLALNQWNSKNWVWTLRCGSIHTAGGYEKRGRLYGIKLLTRNLGAAVPCTDDISIKCNTDMFPDPNGTLVDHWTLSESATHGRWGVPK